jgi:hypothetical protein
LYTPTAALDPLRRKCPAGNRCAAHRLEEIDGDAAAAQPLGPAAQRGSVQQLAWEQLRSLTGVIPEPLFNSPRW